MNGSQRGESDAERRLSQEDAPTVNAEPQAKAGDPDQAWRILDLTNGWIRHAETKAAATIATSGVSAGVLYNLHKDRGELTAWTQISTVACVVLIAIAGLSAAWSLRPRLWTREKPTSDLYFSHIARRHGKTDGPDAYRDAVRMLSIDDRELTNQIAEQIWANAHVSRAKYRWASVGLGAVLLALVALAITVLTSSMPG